MNIPSLNDATLQINDGVALLTFERDDVRNALTGTTLLDDIINTCEWINRSEQIGALILTGAGKAFSSGGNIKDMHERNGMFGGTPLEIQDNYRRGIQRLSLALYRLEVPAIAAMNGAAIGAGLDLACMCDIRIGNQYTKAGETFVNLGLIPGDGGAWFLPRAIGMQRAAELTFSGRVIDADEALRIGLLLEVVDAAELVPRALTLAKQFTAKPRAALRISKRLLQMGQRLGLDDFLDYCASQQSLCHQSEEHHRAVGHMLEKI
jgi:enoyl-CoA hydratase/carnithine racemase